jgi:choline monooxygenase
MGTSGQNREIALFDPSIKLESGASTPPYTWYTDDEIFSAERQRIFQKSWVCVGRIDQVDKPGKFFSGNILGDPYVVVNAEGTLRAFHNVCSHKGCELAPPKGKCTEFVCQYHGWTYKHTGELCKTPHIGKQGKGFDITQLGLKPMSVKQWGPFIFVDLDGSWTDHDTDCRDLEADMAPIKQILDEMGWGTMKHVERRVYEIECNWKVFVDNGLDGGYHVAYVHERLSQGLDFEGYKTEIFPRCSYQVCESNDSDPRLGKKVLYAWAFPNLFINRYGKCMDVNIVMPISPNRCRVFFDWYFDYDDLEDWNTSKTIKRDIGDSDLVQREDVELCEAVQRGMKSMAFQYGCYSSKLEGAVHAFHVLLWKELYGRK